MKPSTALRGRIIVLALALCAVVLGGCGGTDRAAAVSPSIMTQPLDQSVTAGQSASFAVTASGTAPLSYQWQRNGVAIAGANGDTYTLSNTASTDSGAEFTVVVVNATGSTTSSAARLTVSAAPLQLGAAGGTVSSADNKLQLSVAAGALSGATVFSISPIDSIVGLSSAYTLVSGTAFSISWTGGGFTGAPAATVSILDPETGQLHALKFAVVVARDTASGTGVTVVQCGDSSKIYARTTDPHASDYDDAQVVMCMPGNTQVGLADPAPGEAPSIAIQPTDVSDVVDDTATFSVLAGGAATLSYQWRRNDLAIPGANSSSYAFEVTAADSGTTFSVLVSNGYGSVTSREASLTVGTPQPPAAPTWQPPTVISGTSFSVGNDLPQIAQLYDQNIVAWNNNGLLDSDYTSAGQSVHALMHPIRGRPMVLSGPNLSVGYLIFVDNGSTSSCNQFSGNQLSAIAFGFSSQNGDFAPSAPFPLYISSSCINSFAAGLMPDAAGGIVGVTFAVQESNSSVLQMGLGGAQPPPPPPPPPPPGSVPTPVQTSWQPLTSIIAPLATSSDCAYGIISSDSIKGIFQAAYIGAIEPTYATLTFLSTSNDGAFVCAAVQSGNGWSLASALFSQAPNSEPVVAVDGAGNSLVVGSQVIDPNASTPSYAMVAEYLPAGESTWQSTSLDSSNGLALPAAAFDEAGNAFVVWRPAPATGPTVVYAARRTVAGTWEPNVQLSSTAVNQTRFPRICVDPSGNAMAIFEEGIASDNSFTVVSRLWSHGAWSAISPVQSDSNDGRFAECPRNAGFNVNGSPSLGVTWLETDPADASQNEVLKTTISPAQ